MKNLKVATTVFCLSRRLIKIFLFKFFDSNYLDRFRNRSMKQNCKQSTVMIRDQQDKMEIPFDVEIPIFFLLFFNL